MLGALGMCVAWVVSLSPVSPVSGEDGKVQRDQQFRAASMAEVQAQKAGAAGKFDEAVELYTVALDNYCKLLKGFPDYRPVFTRERTSKCVNELRALMDVPELRQRYASKIRDLVAEGGRLLETSPQDKSGQAAPAVPARPAAVSAVPSVRPAKAPAETSVLKPLGTSSMVVLSPEAEMKKEMARLRTEYINAVQELAKLKSGAGRETAAKELEREYARKLDELRKENSELKAGLKKQPAGREAGTPGSAGNDVIAKQSGDFEERMAGLQRQIEDLRREKTALQNRVTELSARPGPAGSEGGAAGLAARLMKEDKLIEANEVLVSALAKTPDDVNLKLVLGMLYCRRGQYAEAARLLKPVVESDETNAEGCLVLGAAYIGLGRLGDAHFELSKAVGFAPDMPEAHYNLAQVLMSLKPSDPKGALEHYRQALQLGAAADVSFEAELNKALNK